MTPEEVAFWGVVVGAIQAGVGVLGLVGLVYGLFQFRLSVHAKMTAEFTSVVTLEIALGDARTAWLAAGIDLADATAAGKPPELLAAYEKQWKSLQEQHLNMLDRFCSGIRQGLIPVEPYRSDFRNTVQAAAEQMDASSRHNSIRLVHDRWKVGGSGRDPRHFWQ